jgi:hypothetical protein
MKSTLSIPYAGTLSTFSVLESVKDTVLASRST